MSREGIDRQSLEKIKNEASERLGSAKGLEAIEDIRIEYLGRKGVLTNALRSIGQLPKEERPLIGSLFNEIKTVINRLIEEKKNELSSGITDSEPYPGDPTLPGRKGWRGGLHLLHKVTRDVKEIFYRMGYSLAEGPEVELDYYNFEALNFPEEHPSRDTQDTFYINRDILLRTQTSPVQVRYMEKNDPPLRIISPGRVYRNETPDPSHSAEFNQMEGLYVDRDVSLADLRNDVTYFIHSYFGKETKVRFRPHFFPFTEPSAEVDMTCFACHGNGCPICQKTGWIEIMGAGMVHPNVFKFAGYDPDSVTGFAFGLGIDRVAMLKYGVDDIRRFLANDIRFLSQFWSGSWVGAKE
ncbi:MAG: phenylalanine--tRNA ligase subunit alpha [Candidatus Krumholzibacteriota bacterium]|nr:phenylalanine--tRNA ligase subunit alpha [Candidatus Krumholzibacteriota bacterium]